MHYCLEIGEIVVIVCSLLDKQDLLSFALTCRHFKETALHALWEDLPSLEPFVRLLPSDTWKESDVASGILKEQKALTPSDLSYTQPYASYIRKLKICYPEKLRPGLVASIARACTNVNVLPRLTALRIIYPGPATTTPYLELSKLLVSPRLTHLELKVNAVTLNDQDTNLVAILSQLNNTTPSMTSFRLGWNVPLANIAEAVNSAICSWTKLRVLECPQFIVLSTDTLTHLASLDRFEELCASLPVVRAEFCSGYKELRRVHLYQHSITNFSRFMHASQSQIIENLHIEIDSSGPPEHWLEFFTAVVDSSSRATETRLHIINALASDDEIGECISGADTLRPLLRVRNLIVLDLKTLPLFRLDDDFIAELAISSPQLEELNIGTETEGLIEGEPTLTLKAYFYVLNHCPNLRELGLVVDFNRPREILAPQSPEWRIKYRQGTFKLHVGMSPPGLPETTAAFLSSIFQVVHLNIPYVLDYIFTEAWLEVEIMLRIPEPVLH